MFLGEAAAARAMRLEAYFTVRAIIMILSRSIDSWYCQQLHVLMPVGCHTAGRMVPYAAVLHVTDVCRGRERHTHPMSTMVTVWSIRQ